MATSYPVLLVLVIPSTLMLAQSASSRVLFGMAKHKTLAIVTLLEGGANLFLSIFLVRQFGILGDAFGTAHSAGLYHSVFSAPASLPRFEAAYRHLRARGIFAAADAVRAPGRRSIAHAPLVRRPQLSSSWQFSLRWAPQFMASDFSGPYGRAKHGRWKEFTMRKPLTRWPSVSSRPISKMKHRVVASVAGTASPIR